MSRPLSTLTLLLATAARLHAAGLQDLIGEYNADRRDVSAALAVPWAPESMAREEALIATWEKRLDGLDYERLDPTARIDWHLLDTQLHERQSDLDLARKQFQEIDPLIAFAKPLQGLLLARSQRQLADPESSAAIMAKALADVKALRKTLDAGRGKDAPADAFKPTPVIAVRAAGAIDEIRAALENWYSLYDGFQPDFTWWAAKPHEGLVKEMSGLSGFLKKEIAGIKGEPDDPLIGDPIGPDAIRAALQAEMIPYSAEELIGIADKEFSWCEAEMKKAAAAMGCASGAEAIAKIKDHHAAPGGQAAAALGEAKQAVAFVKDHDLVTVPPLAEETWGLAMLGPDQQKSLPYAVYGQPRIMVAFAAESMTHEDKLESMRGNNAAFLHIVTPHELIPGHHLQGFMARRNAAYRNLFSTPFLVEGWALHWEMLLWDQGYLDTPEEKVGALFWRMHRCARIIVSLKFHLGEMKPTEMVDFLVERVGHERSGATSEVRRYIGGAYGPLYQVAYMIGGLQIGALQKELTGQGIASGVTPPDGKGAPASTAPLTLRQFHDQILQQGPVPIEMIRAALKKGSLPKDWKPSWNFAG